jgi:predicted dehydrogenase
VKYQHPLAAAVFLLATCCAPPAARSDEADSPQPAPLRIGIIGLDTSHVTAFTKALNLPDDPNHVAGGRVVAAYPRGSRDIESSVSRVPEYTAAVRDLGVEIVDTIPALLERVDAVLLETNDGRPHLEQVLPVLRAGKPVFIDKPVAGSLADAIAIYRLAERFDVPVFSSSALRFSATTRAVREGSIGEVLGCDTFSPCVLEPTHPDLFWYGIHGCEALFTALGPGCESVARVQTPDCDHVTGVWTGGRIGTFRGIRKGKAPFGGTAFGSKGVAAVGGMDGYRPLLVAIVAFLQTGRPPVAAAETLELYAFMEAADESKRRGGSRVPLREVMTRAEGEADTRMRALDLGGLAPPAGRPLPDSLARHAAPPPEFAAARDDRRSPLLFADGTRARTADDWRRRRREILADWTALLGEWPPLFTAPEVEVVATVPHASFTQHTIRFAWTPTAKTTGFLLVPNAPGAGRRPAVLTVFYEPDTAVAPGVTPLNFARQLVDRGFVTLSIGTSEATKAGTFSLYWPDIGGARVQPLSMLAHAAANAWHVLAARPEVDADRIGIVGHSFGGKWALFAACLFDRFACAAWSDPGIVFDDSSSGAAAGLINYWEPWYLGYHPPPWRKRGPITPDNPARGLYPRLRASGRDLHELHALMAPRPFLVSGGAADPPSRWGVLNHARDVNGLLGHDDRVLMTNRPAHDPSPESNAVLREFFEHFLQP